MQMAEPMGMVFANTIGGTYAGWCRDAWHGHGDAADMHSCCEIVLERTEAERTNLLPFHSLNHCASSSSSFIFFFSLSLSLSPLPNVISPPSSRRHHRPHSPLFPSKTLTPKNPKPPSTLLQWNRKPELSSFTPRVAVITSSKGGVGKTTTTANISLSLTRLGFFVVAINADIGLRNLDLLLGFGSV
ncbi:putative septum site-determining protein minD, chloroplastic [Glycine soja]